MENTLQHGSSSARAGECLLCYLLGVKSLASGQPRRPLGVLRGNSTRGLPEPACVIS